jgi:hypothetical protein
MKVVEIAKGYNFCVKIAEEAVELEDHLEGIIDC